ncbi:MAG: DUF3501 family protein [Acidimicrobiales bacterium]|nr:DUF3501 family protein [Acidimicrobiales bacterium]
MTKLTLDDIADLRAYERERAEFRSSIIALKKKRRVGVGPFVTFVFENRDTIRFQIQEMARAEKLISDDAIETELRIYNPLIPEPGHLSATMFIELTTDSEMREWLPKLVGIETAVELRLTGAGGDNADLQVVPCTVDPDHAAQLTRDDTTSAVHYIAWELEPQAVAAIDAGAIVELAVTHANYAHAVRLSEDTVQELLADLRG